MSRDVTCCCCCDQVNNDSIYVPSYTIGDEPPRAEVKSVTFSTLLKILVMDPLHLSEHDTYVCFGYKDPFSYFQPGYFGDKYPTVEGQVKLNTIPGQIRMPGEFPAYFGKGDEEKKRNFSSITPLCDREDSKTIPQSQKGFIR